MSVKWLRSRTAISPLRRGGSGRAKHPLPPSQLGRILELDDNPIWIVKMKLQGLAAHSRPCLQRAGSLSLGHALTGDWMTEARLERAIETSSKEP